MLKINKKGLLILEKDTICPPHTKNIINELNNDTWFKQPTTNFYGRQLAYYLCNHLHLDLSNPEPIDMKKSTFTKVFTTLKIVDKTIKKPLEKYTSKDMNEFINKVREGKVIAAKGSNFSYVDYKNIKRYVAEFKRLFRIYRAYTIKYHPNQFDIRKFEWGTTLKAPRETRHYLDYPYYSVSQLKIFIDALPDTYSGNDTSVYKVRIWLSINLMGRKCEISELKFRDLQFRDKDKLFIQLPDIKKHSSGKVPVEVYPFVKTMIKSYLTKVKPLKEWKPTDTLFISKDYAFYQFLKRNSEKRLGVRLTPKTLRKIGVCIAEQMGYVREDVERIGGWSVNSTVLNHYFKRKGIEVSFKQKSKLNRELQPEVYDELLRTQKQVKLLTRNVKQLTNRLALSEKTNLEQYKNLALQIAATSQGRVLKHLSV